ncbi:MAG: 1,2-phenylacetyl-CoA epoxidase subunit PaaC [Myxococcota bacterium]
MDSHTTGDHAIWLLGVADDHLILAQRLCEWIGHAPTLEEELALANIGLDLLGQARPLYAHVAALAGAGQSADQLALTREERAYRNILLVEQPNGDFAHTMVRQLFFSALMGPLWAALRRSTDPVVAGVAAQAVKESTYHIRHSGQWVIRLGDGTSESHERAQTAVDRLWPFIEEMFEADAAAQAATSSGVGVDPSTLRSHWDHTIQTVLTQATLTVPSRSARRRGGRSGRHTEHLGRLLCELQYLQRAYPGLSW